MIDPWDYKTGYFAIACKTKFDQALAYVVFSWCQQIDWSQVDLKDPFFLYR